MSPASTQSLPLPEALYDADATRALDRYLIEKRGISGEQLMSRAGRFAFDCLKAHWPAARRLWVLCGAGNNGGDGYVLAALAADQGFTVRLRWLADPLLLKAEAKAAWQLAVQAGVAMDAFRAEELADADLLVDGLLGTGLSKPVGGAMAEAIGWLNRQAQPVLALDIPSGINGSTGAAMGPAVQADLTCSFVGLKLGLLTGAGRQAAGQLRFSALADSGASGVAPVAHRLALAPLLARLGRRPLDSHKNSFGHLAVLGGDTGLAGAALIAAEAALRAGAGMVSLISRPHSAQAALVRQPELMALGVDAGIEAEARLAAATALVIGPGLGQAAWGEQLLARALQRDVPRCLDADALNLLARKGLPSLGSQTVLTPHPGEAARLLGLSNAGVQADRPAAARALAARTGAVVILKGAGSLVAAPDGQLWLVDAGNPGMASGGMGDALAGIVGALLAQGMSALDAACLAALVHALAGDAQVERGQRGMLATDLLADVRTLLNGN